jgi:acyl-CoA synthetase (AMP-forming)/AMP-acid ligase II
MKQFHDYVKDHAERTPDKLALTVSGREISYGALDELASMVAQRLVATGMREGDRVALHAPTSIETIACALGVLKAGFVLVLMHYGIAAEKLIHQLDDIKATTLIVPAGASLDELSGKVHLQFVMHMGEWRTRRYAGLNEVYPACNGGLDGNEVRVIFHTSGSTKDSKGVAVSNTNMVAAYTAVSGYLGGFENAVILNFSPLHFDYGFYNIMMPLLGGGHSVTESALPEWPEHLLDLILRHAITGMHILPPAVHYLLQAAPEAFQAEKIKSLKYIASSGQALPPKHIQRLRTLLADVVVYSMYGLTECKRVAYLPPDQLDQRPGSVGKPIPGVRAFLVDQAGQLITEPDCVGELVVAGDLVMLGYWNKPELTRRVIKNNLFGEGRVYFTGDLFKRDTEQYLYFVGRKDNVFTRRTFQVNPREIEHVIVAHEAVSEAVVIPVPDEVAGHVPKACVVLKKGRELSADELIRYCTAQLDWYMVPVMVSFHEALPLNLNGKTTASLLVAGAVAI